MTRRRERNRDARRVAAQLFADNYVCPDCLAAKQLTEDAPGVFVLTVAHDSTCPELARKATR
jgi:hypothetical protein